MRYEDHDGLAVKPGQPATEKDKDSARLTVVEMCPDDARLMLMMPGLVR